MTNETRDERAKPTTLGRADAKKLLESFDTVMLHTARGDGSLEAMRVRPMAVAIVGDDCTLHFITAIDSPKVMEAEAEPCGHVTAQTKTRYLSIAGTFRVTQNRGAIDAAWSKGAELWFPDGKTDPRVAVLMNCPANVDVDVKYYPPGTAITFVEPIDILGNYDPSSLGFTIPPPNSTGTVVVRGFYQWPLIVTGLGYNIANIKRGTANSKRLLTATAAFHVEPPP